MSNEVAERARLIDELGKEMSSLESERDDTLVELQTSRTETEKLTGVRKELEARLAAREAELAETLTEEERLAAELEARNVELRQVQQAGRDYVMSVKLPPRRMPLVPGREVAIELDDPNQPVIHVPVETPRLGGPHTASRPSN